MDKVWRWGIIGPGKIAQKFAAALALVPDATLHAVASRDVEKAKQFAATYLAPVYYGSYEALAQDPDIDVVYIATPHSFHHAHVLICLQHGKPVLCEKPMSVNLESTAQMIAMARQQNVFLMEAMWSRFLPVITRARQLIEEGIIGEVKHLAADFGFVAPFNAQSRLYDLSLGGGSLLDVGIYPIFFALHMLGRPDEIKAFSQLAATGADETTNALFFYKDGRMANILSSITAQTPITAQVTGTLGTIFLERPWYKGTGISVRKNDTITDTFTLPYGNNGFEYQIQEVQQCLHNGLKESALLPLDFSLMMSEVMDIICRISNISYRIQ